jgi:hypothetical protein
MTFPRETFTKLKLRMALALGVFAGFSSFAQASLLIEPSIGYQPSGILELGSSQKFKTAGVNYGVRLGYQFSALGFGAEYYASDSVATIDKSVLPNATYKFSGDSVGAFLAFSPPVLPLRFIASYFFQDTKKLITTIPGANGADTSFKGTGYKVSAYFQLISLVGIGLDYYVSTYTESKDYRSTASFTSLNPQGTFNYLGASLSFPLSF